MNYEKAYKEARERAKAFLGKGFRGEDLLVECVFPELKESEDERIREVAIKILKGVASKVFEYEGVSKVSVLAWLEKQKEQKPISAEDEKEFLEKEVKAFLCNYDKEFDDDAPTYDIAEHFYQLGKNSQEPAEWSEKEKGILLECISVLQNSSHWLLADKLSSLRPQPHWKPSEEQMGALNYAYCELFKKGDVSHNILGPFQSLIDTLSKL